MKEIIHYDLSKFGHLHCDACAYESDLVAFSELAIGTRCPNCGADMLTRGDFAKTKRMLRFIDRLNRWLGPIFGKEYEPGIGENVSVRIHDNETLIRRGES